MKEKLTPFLAFIIILMFMPLGHALMILMEHYLHGQELTYGAIALGAFGGIMAVAAGFMGKGRENAQTILGFIGGILLWTGWIEFGYVYFAHRYQVAPLTAPNGEIITKPEYLLLMSSIGFLIIMMMFYTFSVKTKCVFFAWIQKHLKIKNLRTMRDEEVRNYSMITFMETNLTLWVSYILLMFAYDENILGDRHPVTAVIAFGCLFWSMFLFRNLMKIKKLGPAIRYAIGTVIVFWVFVEVMGRWDLLKEIWVEPLEHKLEMGVIIALTVGPIIYFLTHKEKHSNLKN